MGWLYKTTTTPANNNKILKEDGGKKLIQFISNSLSFVVVFFPPGVIAYYWFQKEVPVVDEYVPEVHYFLSPVIVSESVSLNWTVSVNSGHFVLKQHTIFIIIE